MQLDDGSRIAVIGGGPSGSMVSYFLLEMARRIDISIDVDIFETRDFSKTAPTGCNMCGGIISESLVQMLSAEGINLPPSVVHRGIDSYMLHSDVGNVRIATPIQEMRIAAIYRGKGPKGSDSDEWESFDGYLLSLAVEKGANVIPSRVDAISIEDKKPHVQVKGGSPQPYDLLIGAVGVNSPTLKLFEALDFGYQPPKTSKTYLAEMHLGAETVTQCIGNAMHVFLYDIPGIKFGALIPKGDYITMCLLGDGINKDVVAQFANMPEVVKCFPPGWSWPSAACNCSPKVNIGAAVNPFTDRVVMIGDSGASRLYKDGIGAAYRTAKACAVTSIFQGISAQDYKKHYLPGYLALESDNNRGKFIFLIVSFIQKLRFFRRAVLRMTDREQRSDLASRRMSSVLWDTFTGSAPYKDVFNRTIRPAFLLILGIQTLISFISRKPIVSKGDLNA